MKSVVVVAFIILAFSSFSLAECPAPNRSAHLVLTMEGLFGRNVFDDKVKNLAIKARSKIRGKYGIGDFSYSTPVTEMINCVNTWKSAHGGKIRLSIIGHSFGGRDSLKLAKAMKALDMKIDDFIMLDGRKGKDGFWKGSVNCQGPKKNKANGLTFKRPRNARRAVNFFQCTSAWKGDLLKGRILKGARNIQVKGKSHIELPEHPEVVEEVVLLLGNKTYNPKNMHELDPNKNTLGIKGRPSFSKQLREALTYDCKRITDGSFESYKCNKQQKDVENILGVQ